MLSSSTQSTTFKLDQNEPLRERISFESLPSEIILHILSFQSSTDLVKLALTCQRIAPIVQETLFQHPFITSIHSLSHFLVSLEQGRHRPLAPLPPGSDDPSRSLAANVRSLRIQSRVWGSKGWGFSIGRILALCTRLKSLTLEAIPDLRVKHLEGTGTLTTLSLAATTFRAHSHPSPPPLATTFSKLRHLTMNNLGIPPNSTHFSSLLRAASATLDFLHVSFLRDVEVNDFVLGFSHLQNLTQLRVGSLTPDQDAALHHAIRNLSSLVRVEFAGPTLTEEVLHALPNTVREVTLEQLHWDPEDEKNKNAVEELVAAILSGAGDGWVTLAMWRDLNSNERVSNAVRRRKAESGASPSMTLLNDKQVNITF
ncbi:hypothetical protein T439DRAFT_322922 [Meredithblackwellia eburnea MCA 4105]